MSAAGGGDRSRRRALRIVHLTTFYPPWSFGGDATHVQRLAAGQAARGHRVQVVHAPAAHHLLAGTAAAPPEAVAEAGANAVERIPLPGGGGLEPLLVHQLGRPVLSRARLSELLEPTGTASPDVIHYHNLSLAGGPGALTMGSAVKLYTCHEYWLVCPTHMLFRYEREPCTRPTCLRCALAHRRPPQPWRALGGPPRALRHVDRMIYPSELTRRLHEARGVDRPATVLPHFVSDEQLRSAAALGPRPADAEPFFLYVGRLERIKGVDRLLESYTARERAVPLWLAGDGSLAGELRARWSTHPSVRFLGPLSYGRLGPLYRDALALILPSAGYEVFGQVVTEAFAHATPALVTAVGGARELVERCGGGAVYASHEELDAALDRFARDLPHRDDAGRRGRALVCGELSEERYLDRYEELVEASARP